MIQHKIVACKCKRKKIEKTCEKMGLDNYRYRGSFASRFLFFFARNYLVFSRPAESGAPAVETEQDGSRRGLACIAAGAVATALQLIVAAIFFIIRSSGAESGTTAAFMVMPLAFAYYTALVCSIAGLVRARKSLLGKGIRVALPVVSLVLCNVIMASVSVGSALM